LGASSTIATLVAVSSSEAMVAAASSQHSMHVALISALEGGADSDDPMWA
jgi:hypothetical protein